MLAMKRSGGGFAALADRLQGDLRPDAAARRAAASQATRPVAWRLSRPGNARRPVPGRREAAACRDERRGVQAAKSRIAALERVRSLARVVRAHRRSGQREFLHGHVGVSSRSARKRARGDDRRKRSCAKKARRHRGLGASNGRGRAPLCAAQQSYFTALRIEAVRPSRKACGTASAFSRFAARLLSRRYRLGGNRTFRSRMVHAAHETSH